MLTIYPKGMKSTKNFSINKLKINCLDGKKINTYLIRPRKTEAKIPLLIYFHGGGFVYKAAPHHYKLVKEYAKNANVAVAFVDYRLAFDTKFGTTLSDCVDAYNYILENADVLNIDKDKIGFAGDSAGGYLSLALIDYLSKNKLSLPKFQLLIYPVVDSNMTTESMKRFTDTPMWNSKLNKKMWEIYSKGNKVFNPLESDISYMPKTYIETAEFDCLHDEGLQLHNKLKSSNVESQLYETKGTMHGYDVCCKSKTTKESIKNRIQFLKQF
ncbi:MAG: alpha/beta hydrolase [Erysipelotrichales bacterium]|nr:alpha/beta hydrolase [Erysipelotrichales bacterium]